MSYGTRMALSFALTSLMTVLILVCVVSVVWGNVFSEYTRTNVTEIAQLTSQKLASIYEQNGSWNLSDLVALSDSTIASEDLGLQVMDADGTILYDDTWPAAPVAAELKRLKEEGSSASEKSTEEWSSRAHSFLSEAPTDAEGRAVAEKYCVAVGDVRPLPLDDGRSATLTVVGIRADARADGSGVAGLTLMASPIALRPMNDVATNAGGWEASTLRAWLAGEGLELLPDELADAVVAVEKRTNNVGVTADASAVTQTADELWLFSASEVCGAPGWFVAEYGAEPNYHTGYVDFAVYDALLAAEGEQYEHFRDAGVTGSSDPSGALALTYGGAETPWWYRTAYPYSFTGEDASFFYQVMASGYPSGTGLASESAGVVVGMCL